MTVQLLREDLRPLVEAARRGGSPHPGLLLSRGLAEWPGDGEGGGKQKRELIDVLAKQTPSSLYIAALKRWRQVTNDRQRFASFEATLAGRLYIGVTRDNALEAGVTTSHSYGMPVIPGSAVKGLARATAERMKLPSEALRWMFGHDTEDDANAEAGGLIFHDAWWVGKVSDKPFVPEVVTPHHPGYYGEKGEKPATDFDSPIPAAQIAVTGRFRFVIEGPPQWAQLACDLLQTGLKETGIGGKRSSGYGFFHIDDTTKGN